MNLSFAFVPKYWPLFIDGAGMTLLLAFFTVIFGVVLGVFWALLRMCPVRVLRWIAGAYIEFIRGTPVMVQILLIFYGLPQIGLGIPPVPWLGPNFARVSSGILALSINSSAYVAEIIRSGIQAVDIGQTEASRSLGMSAAQTMAHIVLPQAIRNILPALGNEFVTVIKESSVVMVIGIGELMYKTSTVYNNSYRYIEALLVCAVIYFVMTFITSRLIALAERRLHRGTAR